MRLDIEDKWWRAFAFLDSLNFGRFNVKHVKKFSEHPVHGQKGQRHAAGGFEKIAPVHAKTAAQSFTGPMNQPLDLRLFEGLWRREKFFVGDDLGGNR